ncbi:MAG TPA: hypothetical protein VN648_32110, partial [Candidatus Methylomirabilis sp.]|nr:hypothetical protein [Candidatus Methylomirabilis sp.]
WLLTGALGLTVLSLGVLESGERMVGAAAAFAQQVPRRSLTPEEIRAFQEGDAMGLARAAELNGYPNPVRILEAARAGKIDLYADQRGAIERVEAAAKAKAQALGHQILAEEASLEADFRTGRIVEADLTQQVEAIGRNLAELRLTHLRAHLLTATLLRPEQIEEYYQFRGYVAPSSGHHLGY